MSAMTVPWPGSSGISTVKPASANASARGRIDCGFPVNPCRTRAPLGPPCHEPGSAPGIRFSGVGVIGCGLLPPVVRRRLPVRIVVDAVDGAHRQALAAARAELRDDDDVDPVVEDGPELRGAVADARVAVDALRHLDEEGQVLPLGVALTRLETFPAGCRHRGQSTRPVVEWPSVWTSG